MFFYKDESVEPPLKCQVWSGVLAFVSERVKGFRSAVAREWRMGLFCAPLLSRGPGGQGSAGKGFVMSQGCCDWAALLFSLSAGPQSLSLGSVPLLPHQAEAFLLNELSCE